MNLADTPEYKETRKELKLLGIGEDQANDLMIKHDITAAVMGELKLRGVLKAVNRENLVLKGLLFCLPQAHTFSNPALIKYLVDAIFRHKMPGAPANPPVTAEDKLKVAEVAILKKIFEMAAKLEKKGVRELRTLIKWPENYPGTFVGLAKAVRTNLEIEMFKFLKIKATVPGLSVHLSW